MLKQVSIAIPSLFNPHKDWVITRTAQGKYYVNQKINGHLLYPTFTRMNKDHVCQAVGLNRRELDVAFSL